MRWLLRLNLTIPGLGGGGGGGGGGGAKAPAPPPAPPKPPTQVDARRDLSRRRGSTRGDALPENVRNEGGRGGLNMVQSTARALKQLTGQ